MAPKTGHFISPRGKVISFAGDRERHIDYVMKHPTKFDLEKGEPEKVYKKHKEAFGTEGKARDEILINVVKQGWARIREYAKQGTFSVQVWKWTSSMKDAILRFFEKREDDYGPYTAIQLHSLGDGNYKMAHLMDLGRVLYENSTPEEKAIDHVMEDDGVSDDQSPRTLYGLNKYLHRRGMPMDIEVEKGRGYFYFTGPGSPTWPEQGVYVYRLSDLTFGQWWSEYQQLSGGETGS